MREPKNMGDFSLEFHTLTLERWDDFEQLFGPRGACGGCWCMWWRLRHKDFEAQKGEGNRKAMREIVASGRVPGILAYHDGSPVGWCSVAPRKEFPRLERSRILKPVDDQEVWSIVCLFVAKRHRRMGVSTRLISAAVEYVRKHGGRLVEGYAVDPKKDKIPDAFAFHGLASSFRNAGFKEVIRRSETRPIMRYELP
jgi:GNAT superfamily N-acetyltransferase